MRHLHILSVKFTIMVVADTHIIASATKCHFSIGVAVNKQAECRMEGEMNIIIYLKLCKMQISVKNMSTRFCCFAVQNIINVCDVRSMPCIQICLVVCALCMCTQYYIFRLS